MLIPGPMAEAALGHPAIERHLSAFVQRPGLAGARAGPLPLVPARRGLARTAARTTPHALLPLPPVYPVMNRTEVHVRFPRGPRRVTGPLLRASGGSRVPGSWP